MAAVIAPGPTAMPGTAPTVVIPESHYDVCLYDGFEDLLSRLRRALTAPDEARQAAQGLSESVACYDWASMAPRYDAALLELVKKDRRPM